MGQLYEYDDTNMPWQQRELQIYLLSDTELVRLWYNLDMALEPIVLANIYTEMCMRGIPRIVDGPRMQNILDRINMVIEVAQNSVVSQRAAADLIVRERVCRHCRANYSGTAYGLCSGCGKFQ